MTIDAASSLSSYSYQSTLAASGQANAVFQALAQAYSNNASASSGSDPITALLNQVNEAPLVSAIYSQGQSLTNSGTADANSTATGLLGLSSSQLISGLSVSSVSTLLGDSTSGLAGFGSATSGDATLALLAAEAQKAYGTGNLTADAASQAAANGSTPSTSAVSLLTASAQLAAMNNTFTLLA